MVNPLDLKRSAKIKLTNVGSSAKKAETGFGIEKQDICAETSGRVLTPNPSVSPRAQISVFVTQF